MAGPGSDKTIPIGSLKPFDKIRVVKGERRPDSRFVLLQASNKRDSLPAKVLACQRDSIGDGHPWVVTASAIDPATGHSITLVGRFAGFAAIMRDRWTT